VITPWGSSRAATQYLMTEEILLVVPQGHRLAAEKAGHGGNARARVGSCCPEPHERRQYRADAIRRAGYEPKFS